MALRKKITQPIEVFVLRGETVESTHHVNAVVTDSKGDIVHAFAPSEEFLSEEKIFPRSAVKMIQALAMMESGAVEKYSLNQKRITLACASHYGDSLHTQEVRAWHEQLGFVESDMVCGPQWPMDEKAKEEMIRKGQLPTRYHNNCSGKHTGMLTGLKMRGEPLKNYEAWDHPLQIRLRQIFSELSGEDFSRTAWGVDGCSIPNYTMTLPGLARALSAFLLDPSWGKAQGLRLSQERRARLRQINQAILAEPHYLAGTSAFGTDFIQALEGKVILKGGAEGVYVGILPQEGKAFAVKVSDGAGRAAEAATATLLSELGAINEQEWVRLSEHTEPKIRDRNGQIVGKISVAL